MDTKPSFRFKCASCDQWHDGIPHFGFEYPIHYFMLSESDRQERAILTSDTCVIDDSAFYVRGCLDIPVIGLDDVFSYGVWVSLSKASFDTFQRLFNAEGREAEPPVFAWYSDPPTGYPEADLKSLLHFRPLGTRPFIELEPTDHPLAIEQRSGITVDRLTEIVEQMTGRRQSD